MLSSYGYILKNFIYIRTWIEKWFSFLFSGHFSPKGYETDCYLCNHGR